MGIFDNIKDDAVRKGPTCLVKLTADKLDKADARALAQVLADTTIPGSLIARRLNLAGHRINQTTIQRHRRGECACTP